MNFKKHSYLQFPAYFNWCCCTSQIWLFGI